MNTHRFVKYDNTTVNISPEDIKLGISLKMTGIDWGGPIVIKAIGTKHDTPMVMFGYVKGHMGWASVGQTCYYPGYFLVLEHAKHNYFVLREELSVTREMNMKTVMAECIDKWPGYEWNIHTVRRKRIVV